MSFLNKKMESYRFDGDAKTQITLTMTEELCIQKQAEQPHLTLEECEYIFCGIGILPQASFARRDDDPCICGGSGWQSLSVFGGQWNREILHITKQWQKYFGAEQGIDYQ